ncbi:hypothetical protein RFI_25915 [Reticulomyxa filosa]|uniref:FAD/NAD(P)-binding domain-containing protein n=1 Tax=Reticulomyxa filosa TaxID=46433 RepID=X6MC79_RETFI|nr:hypothetical protein RFI_25915 [Reticulomyxa filosa]|eukprot:ETO11459.1 hypothetical protein RFI_25915 [Reticulomyxa filosa]
MSVAGQILRKQLVKKGSDITVFEKNETHYYQPGFTMLSGGLLGSKEEDVVKASAGLLYRPVESVFDEQINIVRDEVGEFDPKQNKVITKAGKSYTYDYLIVACGNKLRYDLIEGAVDALNDPESSVGSMYDFTYAKKINQLRAKFNGGKIIATQAPMPIKCAGAPQKWVNLCEESMRVKGIRSACDIHFYTALPAMFGVKKYSDELYRLATSKHIHAHFEYDVQKVDHQRKKVYLKKIGPKSTKNEVVIESFDLLHLVPPQRPHDFVAKAAFCNDAGYVDVNKHTLQSTRFSNVFALGDCSSLPTSRTAAAVFSQSPILVYYLERQMLIDAKTTTSTSTATPITTTVAYDGYTSCPIFVGDKKLMLAEFLYDGQVSETFARFVDQRTPTTYFYYLKRYVFPHVYWNYVPLAQWFGRNGFNPPHFFLQTPSLSSGHQALHKSH